MVKKKSDFKVYKDSVEKGVTVTRKGSDYDTGTNADNYAVARGLQFSLKTSKEIAEDDKRYRFERSQDSIKNHKAWAKEVKEKEHLKHTTVDHLKKSNPKEDLDGTLIRRTTTPGKGKDNYPVGTSIQFEEKGYHSKPDGKKGNTKYSEKRKK